MFYYKFCSLNIYLILVFFLCYGFSYGGEIRILPYIGINNTYIKSIDSIYNDAYYNFLTGLKLNEFINIEFEYMYFNNTYFYYRTQSNYCKEVLDTHITRYFMNLNFNKVITKYINIFILIGLGFVEQKIDFSNFNKLNNKYITKIRNISYCGGFGFKYVLTSNIDIFMTYKIQSNIMENTYKSKDNFNYLCSFGYIYFI